MPGPIITGDFNGNPVPIEADDAEDGSRNPRYALGATDRAILEGVLLALGGAEGGGGAATAEGQGAQTDALTSILAKIISAPATEAKQDGAIAATNLVGTRAYGAPQRIASAAATTLSGPITGTEVLLHATGRQFVLAVAGTGTPTIAATAAIPLEDGEKFHMRITPGQRIATIRDTADGFLHIAPVA